MGIDVCNQCNAPCTSHWGAGVPGDRSQVSDCCRASVRTLPDATLREVQTIRPGDWVGICGGIVVDALRLSRTGDYVLYGTRTEATRPLLATEKLLVSTYIW